MIGTTPGCQCCFFLKTWCENPVQLKDNLKQTSKFGGEVWKRYGNLWGLNRFSKILGNDLRSGTWNLIKIVKKCMNQENQGLEVRYERGIGILKTWTGFQKNGKQGVELGILSRPLTSVVCLQRPENNKVPGNDSKHKWELKDPWIFYYFLLDVHQGAKKSFDPKPWSVTCPHL